MPQLRVYPGHDVELYRAKREKAIRRYGMPPAAPRYWGRDLDYDAWAALGYMQPSAALWWQKYLYEALIAAGVADRTDVYTITIIDRCWHFGERKWDFQRGRIEYQVRRALKGLNYLVMIEFQVFGNVRHYATSLVDGIEWLRDCGCVIAPHIQGLLWGKRPSRRQRAQFPGGLFGVSGIKIVRRTDFAGAVRYMVKPPMGELVHPRADGRLVRYPWPGMTLRLHHLFLRQLCNVSYPDLSFASGAGSAVLAHAKRLARDS